MGDRISASKSEGIGLEIPPRRSDCTGKHPSWYPFQIQVDACDGDAVEVAVPQSARHVGIGQPSAIPWED